MTYNIINAFDIDALQRQVNEFIQKNKGCVLHGPPVHDAENGYIQVILTGPQTQTQTQTQQTKGKVSNSDKIYVGVGKEMFFPNGGAYVHLSIRPEHRELMENYARESGMTHLDVFRRKTPDTYGNTHYAMLTPEYKREPEVPEPVRAAAITRPCGGLPDIHSPGSALYFCGDAEDIPF